MTNTHKSIEELRQRILDEMNARRQDGKTYIDAEWLLKEYEELFAQQQVQEAVAEIIDRKDTVYIDGGRGKFEPESAVLTKHIIPFLFTLQSKKLVDKTDGF